MTFRYARSLFTVACAALGTALPSFAKDVDAKISPVVGVPEMRVFEMAVEVAPGVAGRKLTCGEGEITVSTEAALTSSDVKTARAFRAGENWTVMITFAGKAKQRLFELTRDLAKNGRRLAIIVDGKVISAPVVREAIPSGQAQIASDFTKEKAEALAKALQEKRGKPGE